MAEPFLGEIRMFGFNFNPRGWAFCNGALLPISQNTALFSLLGTIYGGDGRTTFGLPNLRSRSPVHFGQGPGLSNIPIGSAGGSETTTLITQNLPAHSHTIQMPVNAAEADSDNPEGTVIANRGEDHFAENASTGAFAQSFNSGNTGNNTAFNNRSPYLGINFCIALVGVFPSRN